MTTPIRSLDIRPGAKDDALLTPQPRRTIAEWLRERDLRIEARSRAGRRLAYHILTATAPALRKPPAPRRSGRLWRWWMHAAMMIIASAVVAIGTVWLLRRGLL